MFPLPQIVFLGQRPGAAGNCAGRLFKIRLGRPGSKEISQWNPIIRPNLVDAA